MFVIVCVPDIVLVPDHPPLAVQEVAFWDDQVRVAEFPEVTLVGLAVSVMVGTPNVVALTVFDCAEVFPAASYAET
jgi:hypothetical protein